MKINIAFVICIVMTVSCATQAIPLSPVDDAPVYGPELEGFTYPYAVSQFEFTSQRQQLHMAYMDVAPDPHKVNGRTVVLMHGKNYCSATWGPTIRAMTGGGFRVIAIDQIGFCKSSKPQTYQFSFEQLARNTRHLLQSLHINKFVLVGHSTGGMLAIRYALSYADDVDKLVLVDPIGLEDWRAKGVPPVSIDQWYARELNSTAERIRTYEKNTYFAGQWRADYEPSVQMLAGMYRGPGKEAVAWNSALLYDMILTQPVYYQFDQLKVRTLLIIGDKDNTAIGKEFAPADVKPTLGNYPRLAKQAAQRIPNARLIEFPEAGHAPQMQLPDKFNTTLLHELATP